MSYLTEPFLPSILSHGLKIPNYPSSAWPATRGFVVLPAVIYAGWNLSTADAAVVAAVRASGVRIRAKAVELGQKKAAVGYNGTSKYPNYSAGWTTGQELFGANVEKLREVKRRWDPRDVMALTGGFKF